MKQADSDFVNILNALSDEDRAALFEFLGVRVPEREASNQVLDTLRALAALHGNRDKTTSH